MKRWVKISVYGTVQKVGYQDHVKKYADQFNIEGTVQNEADGSVLIYAVGLSTQLDNFIDYLYKGSSLSVVEEIAIEIAVGGRDFRGVFRVIGSE